MAADIESRIAAAAAWLLDSGIQCLDGEHAGGINAYHTGSAEKPYHFIYSEITGYGISTFLYLDNFFHDKEYLNRARMAAEWITGRALLPSGGVRTRFYWNPVDENPLYSSSSANAFAFDTAMVLTGFAYLYKATRHSSLLQPISAMSSFLLSMQRPDGSFNAFCLPSGPSNSFDKWSSQPSSFHAKLAISLLEAREILGDRDLLNPSLRICRRSSDFLSSGRFITNLSDSSTDTHPHCYSAEGLLYAGLELSRHDFVSRSAAATSFLLDSFSGVLPCSFSASSANPSMRSDTVAQLLRLAVILDSLDYLRVPEEKLASLYDALISHQSASGRQAGGFLFGRDAGVVLNHANAWATMFAIQAMIMYKAWLDGKRIGIKPFV